jgi:hypothetical protein
LYRFKGTLAKLLASGAVGLLIVGCATLGPNAGKRSIDKTLADWKTALEAQDVDGVVAAYSEGYRDDRGTSKTVMRDLLIKAKTEGRLKNSRVDMTGAITRIELGTAKVGPVKMIQDTQSDVFELTLKQDTDNVWRIVGSGKPSKSPTEKARKFHSKPNSGRKI